jgi:hypothetical protein
VTNRYAGASEETMNLSDLVADPSAKWDRKPPAEPEAIQRLIAGAGVDLPEEYLSLLRHSNGGEGELGVEPGWFQLWPTEEVLDLNRDYEVAEFAPGFFAFGSSGGGEILAFDLRGEKPWKVVMIPFIPMEPEEAIAIAEHFGAFVQSMGRESGAE